MELEPEQPAPAQPAPAQPAPHQRAVAQPHLRPAPAEGPRPLSARSAGQAARCDAALAALTRPSSRERHSAVEESATAAARLGPSPQTQRRREGRPALTASRIGRAEISSSDEDSEDDPGCARARSYVPKRLAVRLPQRLAAPALPARAFPAVRPRDLPVALDVSPACWVPWAHVSPLLLHSKVKCWACRNC